MVECERGFRMTCVLRVFGRNLDVQSVTNSNAMVPYRIEDGGRGDHGMRCLHYDIFREDQGDFMQCTGSIRDFIRTNEASLTELAKRGDVEGMVVDLAIYIRGEDYSRSLTLDTQFVKDLAGFGLALTLSLYATSDDDGSSWAVWTYRPRVRASLSSRP
jgi:hypothetical protein